MSTITPGRLLNVDDAADAVAILQTNMEILTEEIWTAQGTHEGGSPTTIIGPPTTGAHVEDEIWRDALGGIFQCITAGTPGDWVQARPAPVDGEPGSGTIPIGYLIRDAQDNGAVKYHNGSFEWRIPQFDVDVILLNGATAPASLAGGIAWAAGTAPGADVADQISMWVGDFSAIAGSAAMKIRGEKGGITQLGDGIAIDSLHANVGSQARVTRGGLGALALLSTGANNQSLSFGAFYNGSAWEADSTRAMLLEVGSGVALYFNTGLTDGGAPVSWTQRYTFIQAGPFTRFLIGSETNPGTDSNNVLGISNGTAPTTNPTNMATFWAESGEPRFRTSGGKIRQLVRAQSHANATAETPTATHTLRMFDDAGTEYRVLAIAV